MEAASLALAVFTSFKEVYLVCRFVYRVNVSKRHASAERREVESKFRYEVLFLQSLGSIFFQTGRIVENEVANQRWLRQIHDIIERMRLLLGDYSRVAAEEDQYYQKYSPFLNSSTYDTNLIEFDLNEELPEPARPVSFSMKALRLFGIRASQKVDENLDAWKWALVEKRRFEKLIADLHEENKRLKDILPLISTLSRPLPERTAPLAKQSTTKRSDDTKRLGLAVHGRIKEIVDGETKDFPIFKENLLQVTDSDSCPLAVYETGNTKSTRQRVLVEHKYYQKTSESTLEDVELDQSRARQLASLLFSAGAGDLATLGFRGLKEDPGHDRYSFVFNFPAGTNTNSVPISLFELIQKNSIDTRLNLPHRFNVASKLAKAIAAFHSDGWYHKSLRSESIFFFHQVHTKALMVDAPYLVNFEYSRPQDSYTKMDFDGDYERNLYRHPNRQGKPTAGFTCLHEIYSLGVILLEIGLWQTVASLVKEVKLRSGGGPNSVTSILKQLTKRRLSHHMGPTYADAVMACIDDRLEHRITDPDFPMVFHDEVIRKIDIRALCEL